MKYLHLIWAALFRRKVRTIFTLLSVTAAFLLFGVLDSARSGFEDAGAGVPGAYRLITYSKVNFGAPLPLSLFAEIQAVPGVLNASYASAFGGFYQDPKSRVPVEAYEANYFNPELYPEWYITPEHRQAFRTTRTGALAGETLANKYNWKVGDRIPLRTNLPQTDGSTTWIFDLVGIYRIDNPNMKLFEGILYVNWDYLDEARQSDKGTVHWYAFKVADLNQADYITQAVDALSANSTHETKTQSEQAFVAEYTKQFANIGLIVSSIMGAVFFTLVLLTGNAMSQAVRERVPEMAILKTLGFTSRSVMSLVLSESVLLLLLGSVLGLILSVIAVSAIRSAVGPGFPISPVTWDIWFRGLLLAILVGLIVGALPALRGLRLRIVDALSGH